MNLKERLLNYFAPDQVLFNIDIAPYLTSKVRKKISCLVRLRQKHDWQSLSEFLKKEKIVPGIIGGGSNMVIIKDQYPFYILNQYRHKEIIADDKETVLVKVSSGYNMNQLVNENC
ncbi:MAG: hypothetical protein KatS3mg090_0827 [Patescibacteria group bacterium]|nr:MAG: hypothetical protein KatS3mg090_0827 [Patescibacteria group bacterium]